MFHLGEGWVVLVESENRQNISSLYFFKLHFTYVYDINLKTAHSNCSELKSWHWFAPLQTALHIQFGSSKMNSYTVYTTRWRFIFPFLSPTYLIWFWKSFNILFWMTVFGLGSSVWAIHLNCRSWQCVTDLKNTCFVS